MRLSANRATLNSKCTVSLLSLLQCSFRGLYSIIKHTHLSYQAGRPYPQHITIYPHHSSSALFCTDFMAHANHAKQDLPSHADRHGGFTNSRLYPIVSHCTPMGPMLMKSKVSTVKWLLKSDEIP